MHTNRLAKETSPYLLQHAHNPVDWYPWGPEAFEAARKLNRPIFLSVGYSTCYWCHVMERQSFENAGIAAEMNAKFICIKVDREERPDVDQLYMTALQVIARQGGWPMSMFLLPDLRPFYGGTYFPPEDGYGRPGFKRILGAIDDGYRNKPEDMSNSAEQITNILRQLAEPGLPREDLRIDDAWITEMIARSTGDFDPFHGGFGDAPKFPRETVLEFVLLYLRDHPDAGLRDKMRKTLDAMAMGGIRDHLGGGFHRYSTDSQWLVPHFEIMLYDNAMLAWIYAEAFGQWGEPRDAAICRGVLDFVLREMTSPSGMFYTAFDAEVDAQEGGSYLWTRQEVRESLEKAFTEQQAARFSKLYGLDDGPNFADPHVGNGRAEKNVLFLSDPAAILDPQMALMRQKLLEVRRERKQPMLDRKVLASWNGLMIRALAHAGKILTEERYSKASARAADELLKRHREDEGRLLRVSFENGAKLPALLDDYANVIQALLDLKRRAEAEDLSGRMIKDFFDPALGGFFFTDERADDLIVRQKVGSDSPLPSGNGVAAQVCLALGKAEIAARTISAFAGQMQSMGEGMSALLIAAMNYAREKGALEIAAGAQAGEGISSPDQLARAVLKVEAKWVDATHVNLICRVASEYHITAHGAPSGVSLSVEGGDRFEIAYPAGREKRFEFSDVPLTVYEDEFTIGVAFAKAPVANVNMTLSYQACSDSACLPVAKQRISTKVAHCG